jgi:colicin import membrane protein
VRTRRSDDIVAVVLAILVHALIVAVLVGGLWWTKSEVEVTRAGGMAADVVDMGALSAAAQRALRAPSEPEPLPVPEPEAEPDPEPAPAEAQPLPQEPLPQPEPEDQDEVADVPTPVKAVEPAPREEKRRQEQVDLTEDRARQEKAQRLERERLAQLQQIRAARAAASREARLAEQRLEQLTAARTGGAAEESARADAAASGAGDDDLKGRYAAALQEAIRAKWTRPDSVAGGALCVLEIRQLPGGEVVDVQVASPCSYDEQGRRSIEAAVLKAQPLPYAGFESVFSRTLRLRFRAD